MVACICHLIFSATTHYFLTHYFFPKNIVLCAMPATQYFWKKIIVVASLSQHIIFEPQHIIVVEEKNKVADTSYTIWHASTCEQYAYINTLLLQWVTLTATARCPQDGATTAVFRTFNDIFVFTTVTNIFTLYSYGLLLVLCFRIYSVFTDRFYL